MRKILQIFFRAPGTHPWRVLLAQLAAGLTEGIGLVTLMPIISLATTAGGEPTSEIDRLVLQGFDFFGVEPQLAPLLVIFAVALCLKAALQIFAMRYVGYAAAEVATKLRREIIANVLRVRWRFLVDQSMGRVANALSVDATRAGKTYVQAASFAAQCVQAAFYIVFAFVVSFQLAIAGFLVGLVVTGALHFLVRLARKAGWRQTANTQELVVSLSDTLNNIKPIKAMAREEPFGAFMEKRTDKLRKSLRVQVITTEALSNLQDIMVVILLSASFYVAFVVWDVPLAELVVMGLVIRKLVGSIGKVQRALQKALVLEGAFFYCTQLIDDAKAEAEPNPGSLKPTFEQGLRLQNVTFGHGESTTTGAFDGAGVTEGQGDANVLHDVSLEVPRGDLTVLIGPSGSGKTTIVDLILGLHQVESGRILVDGHPLEQIDLHSWRRLLAYVPQDQALLHDSIENNVSLGDPSVSRTKVENALRLAGCWDFVSALPQGLDTVVGEKGARLSGGQRQRIGLARALVFHPKLLILDEVTSALDQATAEAIAKQVKRLSRGVTVLAVTHRQEFLDLADNIYRVDRGHVSNAGTDVRQLRVIE